MGGKGKITDTMRLNWLNRYLRRTNRWADVLPVICESDTPRKTCHCNMSNVRKTIDAVIHAERKRP